jgi:hypothetical protein
MANIITNPYSNTPSLHETFNPFTLFRIETFILNTCWKKGHFTLSYVFSKSILKALYPFFDGAHE